MEPSTTPESAPGTVITDATPVRLHLRTVISLIVGIVTLVLGSAGGYYALASTDKALEVKVEKVERRAGLVEEQLKAAATKADLRELRLQVRMDLLNAVWECTRAGDGASSMQCRPRLSHGYAAGE